MMKVFSIELVRVFVGKCSYSENSALLACKARSLSCSCLDLFCAMSCCMPTKWCIGQPHDRRVSACARVHVHVLQFTFHPPQYNSIDKGKVNLKLETEKTFETYKIVNHLLCLVKLISLRIIIYLYLYDLILIK